MAERENSRLRLAYETPARDWESEALPIGNGRLGAMIMGEASAVRLQFNVDSLWTGGTNPSGEYSHEGFGNYQAFGDVFIELDGLEQIVDYRRSLDLARAIHETTFRGPDGAMYDQHAFASHPAQLLAVRISTDCAGGLTGRIRLSGAHAEVTRVARTSAPGLEFSGELENGLKYAASLLTVANGCSIASRESYLTFDGCTELTVFLAAATNYRLDAASGYRDSTVRPALETALRQGVERGFDALMEEHRADYQSLFKRVSVQLGPTSPQLEARPLDSRIRGYEPGGDPGLADKLFQYGRYLLISSSRANALPANLQGLWNHENEPPWHCDYHNNINVQMNYWPAETTSLPECHLPLFDLLDETMGDVRAASRAEFGEGSKGFTYRTSQNVFGGMGWEWNTTANAWYAMHYWEHFAFTRDGEFLRARAWPYLREASEFWLHRLTETPEGNLVAPLGWSPEHGPREDGVSYDQQLIFELFASTLLAADELDIDDTWVDQVRGAKERLLGPRIGRYGQLQEWTVDRDDPHDRHRHTSHLIAVYPGNQISVTKTPELAEAARVALRARGQSGDSRRSWTWPWRCALFSRLGANHCHEMIDGLIQHNLLSNLITTHPPLQIDGNLGMTAAIAEMLLQSHAEEISLLPGVDLECWAEGSFDGLRARGGFEVSAAWSRGRLTEASIESMEGATVTVRSTPLVARVFDASGCSVDVGNGSNGTVRFNVEPGGRYILRF